MRLRQQMRARRHLEAATTRADLASLRTEVAALRAELAALRPEPVAPPADDVARDYLAWRAGPLLRLAKALTRRTGSAEPPALARGNAMRALCEVLLAAEAEDRHRRVGDTVTDLLGDTSWRNDADLIRTLIEARDGAAPLRAAVSPHEWIWPVPGAAVSPDRHEVLPGSEGARVAAVAAPGLRAALPLVVAG
jgi:hypothetical protein